MKLYRRLPRIDLPNATYFATVSTAGRKHWFSRPACAEALCHLICAERGRSFLLHAFVVMPDHYHLLVTLLGDYRIPSVVGKINSVSARRVNALVGRCGPIWSRRFYDHVVRNGDDFDECFSYIHDNPRASALVPSAAEYPYSSAAFFECLQSPWGQFDPA
jgi:REP element-mobilizing transposase RayT